MPSGNVSNSVATGGALHLDNSGSTGAGAVLCSNRGNDAGGRLLVVNQSHPANPQHAVRIQNAGTASTVSIYHDPAAGAGDPSAEAVDIVSTNVLDTALGVRGREAGRGTVKITHEKPPGSDANASALSIALAGEGTRCQGIFIGNDADNPTTGDLLHIRNGGPGTDRLRLTADGLLAVAKGVLVSGAVRSFVGTYFTELRAPSATGGIAGDGTAELRNLFALHASPHAKVGAGWTVVNYSPVRIDPPSGAGYIHHLTGVDIRDFNDRGAFNYSLAVVWGRRADAALGWRQPGLAVKRPTRSCTYAATASTHGAITVDETTSDPPPPAAGAPARLYVKNANLVVQWQDGARILYTKIPLDAPGPYPVTVPVTTGTTPP